MHLLSDGSDTGKTLTLDAAGNWVGSFADLAKYNADGAEIAYTVKEDALPNYNSQTTGDAAGGFTITNVNTEKVTVPVEKKWDDAANQDGKRPVSVTVHLLADGVDTGQMLTLDVTNSWKDTFANLPKYTPLGAEITYTVSEDAVDGYTAEVTGDAASGFTVTNTEVLPTTPETPGNPETPEPKKPGKKKVPYTGDAGILPAATTLAMGVVSVGSAYVVRRHSKRDKQ